MLLAGRVRMASESVGSSLDWFGGKSPEYFGGKLGVGVEAMSLVSCSKGESYLMAALNYTRAVGDGPSNEESCSSDEDAAKLAPPSPNLRTKPHGASTDLTCISPSTRRVFSDTNLELMISQPRVRKY
ncbi:hypothetical protein TNCV_4070341 [Trichonephila clavipes]|nr:hypothetical protein TNCV_4070341 [Trichonephila clavipes]